MEHDFQGPEGQTLPDLPDAFRWKVYQRYAELYQQLTGNPFEPTPMGDHFDKELKYIFNPYL